PTPGASGPPGASRTAGAARAAGAARTAGASRAAGAAEGTGAAGAADTVPTGTVTADAGVDVPADGDRVPLAGGGGEVARPRGGGAELAQRLLEVAEDGVGVDEI